MKTIIRGTWLFLALIIGGCGDKIDLEAAAVPLAAGIDLDDNNQLRFYVSNPVFGDKNNEEQQYNIPVTSLRESRSIQDAYTSGALEGRNYQVYVVGRKLLQHENWFKILDVVFRDARNTVLDRMVAFNGPLEEMFTVKTDNQPPLPVILRGMVDSKSKRGATVLTTVQDMHRQIFEEALTPSLSEVTYDAKQKSFRLSGTTLLTHKGKYATSIGFQESVLLNLLKKDATKGVSLSFAIPGEPNSDFFSLNRASFSVRDIDTKIKSSYSNNNFHFLIRMKVSAAMTEQLFTLDIQQHADILERKLSQQMQKQLEKLIRKFQKHQIDPVGFGIYARAYQYRHYKENENNWGEAFSDAEIKCEVKVTINSMGTVK
ncbi:Ger(x)C family germination protein [Paenibacillus cellulosilyticus]|uniref:Ger(X)C family germination protein n=1 Tax=Paenibacillus cellulosilyticus TaxID=375489 RepID=A0A2V2Z0M0_9BACL|nr:Ger(x)C family spore germination protein [Paenibacillus cellulosilyticus]PWW06575.1 Ger(x)C family germination protein [Paenibacillus cellulosilyticus]QKS46093.1 Ger(x)C family spore germination protein [Paenibacillus cellulosilyticus]